MKAGSAFVVASVLALAVVSTPSAQQPPPKPPPQPPAPAPSLPAAPAALSVPNPLAGFRPGPRDLYRSPDGSDRFQHLSQYPVPPVVHGPYYPCPIFHGPIYQGPLYPGYYPYAAPFFEASIAETYRRSMAESYLRRQRERVRGGLMLQDAPASAQVFVDGYYRGVADEFGVRGRAIDLDAGAHRIELRAAGFETLIFDVMIAPNDILRYRGEMQTLASRPPAGAGAVAAPQPTATKPFYVIPNCYAGDKPPSSSLPKGCDAKKLQTRK